jgi:DNA-directed RNA polymerase subunit L/DNA-directed RNA polymerase alpha subunit
MISVFNNIDKSRLNTLKFQLAPTHIAYANTLRRLCITSVSVVGFNSDIREDGSTTDVKIIANSTPMTNEMLAHRIGLLPVHEESPLTWDPEKYEFSLNIINESNTTRDVTASDIIVKEKTGDAMVQVPSSRFFKPHPLTRETCLIAVLKPLLPGGKPEEICFTARATVGTGRENARWIPTVQCAYSYTLDKTPENQEAVFNEWIARSKKILDPLVLKEKEPEKRKSLWKEFETLEINRCYLKNEKGEAESFDFTIESAGVLTPEYIIEQACENGAIMCKRYSSDNLPDDVVVNAADSRIRGWDFIFQRQDHTLGNCIQSWLDENLVGKGEITFAGYDIPHPLRDEMVIRIGSSDGEEKTARDALRMAMISCGTMFTNWREQWSSLTRGSTPSIPISTGAKKLKFISRPKKLIE